MFASVQCTGPGSHQYSRSWVSSMYEHVARLAQEYVRDRAVLVLGCGASAPYGIPTMPKLAEGLIAGIPSDAPEWQAFAEALSQHGDLERTLHEVELPETLHRQVVEVTWALVNAKDRELFGQLLSHPKILSMGCLFRYLLRVARPHLSVVTTNYDRLAEYAADLANADAFTGFTSGLLRRFKPDRFAALQVARLAGFEGRVDIWQVHGSLDWFLDASNSPVSIPLASEVPPGCSPLIVTPGVSKYRDVLVRDPFRTVLGRADSALKTAGAYLCIGYGFNDEHVQPVLVSRVCGEGVPLVLVTKDLTEPARKILSTKTPPKYLVFTEADGGTMVYSQDAPNGEMLPDVSLWQVPEFLRLLEG